MGSADGYILVGEDRETIEDSRNKFTPLQKMVRITRSSELLVAASESFIDQQPAGRECCYDIGKEWPVKIVGHHDAGEQAVRKWPWAIFSMERLH